MTSNKDGRQQNPHDSGLFGQRRLFLTLICTNHPQFVLWVETFLVFVTTIKFRNLLTTWALTSCDLTIFFFHGHKNNGLLPLVDENKYILHKSNVFTNSNKEMVLSNKVGRPQNTHDSGQQTFLDFDLQKRQFVSWVETFLVFVTTFKIRNLLTWF